MSGPPIVSKPNWTLDWASSLVQEEPSSIEAVRAREVNEVLRLSFSSHSLFLKIGPSLKPEYERIQWLQSRQPAPQPIAFSTCDGVEAILMSAIKGENLADLCGSLPPQTIIERLASALQRMHATSVVGWPFGGSGVLVHGDACLPNFMYDGDELSGYIDLGEMAVADAEVDLAAAIWSLQYNLGAGHGVAFLREYGFFGPDEDMVERLRLRYDGSG